VGGRGGGSVKKQRLRVDDHLATVVQHILVVDGVRVGIVEVGIGTVGPAAVGMQCSWACVSEKGWFDGVAVPRKARKGAIV